MPWTIGAFTFPYGEVPTIGTKSAFDGGEQIWADFNPVGSNTTILTYLGQKSEVHNLYAIVSLASKNSLKAIYDTHAATTFLTPRHGAAIDVQMTKFRALSYPGIITLYEVWITLVEQ